MRRNSHQTVIGHTAPLHEYPRFFFRGKRGDVVAVPSASYILVVVYNTISLGTRAVLKLLVVPSGFAACLTRQFTSNGSGPYGC